MERSLTIADWASAFRRRAWILTFAILIGTPLSLSIAYLLPPVYSATAQILVESEQIPSDLARSTVTTSAAERLQLIEQRLMTRENLIGVIERQKLYSNRPDMTATDKVAKLRESTMIEADNTEFGTTLRKRRGPTIVTTFTITFEADRPRQTAKVVNELVTMIVEQNLQSRNARASETNDFFKQEVERREGELLIVESQISAYKRENEDALPDSLEFRRAELASLKLRLFDREQSRLTVEESKRALEQSLITGVDAATDRPFTEVGRQLRELEQTYAEQSAVYAENHPTMRAMAARIKALRQNIGSATAGTDGASLRETEIKQQIRETGAQLALLNRQDAEDVARKVALEASISRTPDVEMALNALSRSRSSLQVQYEQAVVKQAEAETGEKLEINRQAERFEIIEQARVPDRPESPNRPLIAAGGVFGSATLGVALMVLAELLNTAIGTPRDLERQLQLRPIVNIPYIRTAAEFHRRRLRMAAVVVAALVILPGGLYAIDQYYLPLTLLAENLLDRTGLSVVLQLIEQRF